MFINSRGAASLRAHWRRIYLPVGFVLNIWGNALYDTPHRTASWILFIGGFALALRGMRYWRGFTDEWGPAKRVRQFAVRQRKDPRLRRLWGYLKLTVWGVAVFLVVRHAVGLTNRIVLEPDRVDGHFSSALLFMHVWGFLPIFGQMAEPKNPPMGELLDRLSARITRAMVSRTVANAAGIYFAGAAVYALVASSRPSLVVPAAVTLGVAMIASGHKSWTRLRKLSTQLHSNIQTLERDLVAIPNSKEKASVLSR